jgi:hypothetical protein
VEETMGELKATLPEVLEAIKREREYQDQKYGQLQSRAMSVGDWILVLEEEIAEARLAWVKGRFEDALREILQVATVAVAAILQHGIVEREELK